MKTAHTLTALALAALLSTSASAQERRRDARDDDKRPNREEILERFDTNKDGKLDQKERDAAREALGRKGDRKKSNEDKQGTPPLERGERPMPSELLRRFDKNKDGRLDQAEREAARKALGRQGDPKRSNDDEKGAPPWKRGERPMPSELLRRFDRNKDGRLDQAEREAAREALGQPGNKRRSGDHEGAPPRRRGERPVLAELLKRFDKNKDGKLDEAERAEARKALARRQGRGGEGVRRRREAGGDGGGDKGRKGGDRPPRRRRSGDDGPPRGGRD